MTGQTILAIDPGTHQSAWARFEDGTPANFGICDNLTMLQLVESAARLHPAIDPLTVVIEKVESFGMAVGAEVFETVRWAGRFEQAAQPAPVVRIGRKAVKVAITGSPRAKDANIRQAVMDRFGGSVSIKKGGVLYGVKADIWQAIAVGLTYLEQSDVR